MATEAVLPTYYVTNDTANAVDVFLVSTNGGIYSVLARSNAVAPDGIAVMRNGPVDGWIAVSGTNKPFARLTAHQNLITGTGKYGANVSVVYSNVFSWISVPKNLLTGAPVFPDSGNDLNGDSPGIAPAKQILRVISSDTNYSGFYTNAPWRNLSDQYSGNYHNYFLGRQLEDGPAALAQYTASGVDYGWRLGTDEGGTEPPANGPGDYETQTNGVVPPSVGWTVYAETNQVQILVYPVTGFTITNSPVLPN